eukprot:scaffold32972_cov135-Isochrysis_galbana.AAC.1
MDVPHGLTRHPRSRPPLSLLHDTGVGWVAPHTGQYADALSRRTKVCLILVESLGGIYYDASKLQLHTNYPSVPLWSLRHSHRPHDRTHYGRASASQPSYLQKKSLVEMRDTLAAARRDS